MDEGSKYLASFEGFFVADGALMKGQHIPATDIRALRAIPLSDEQRTLLERVCFFMDSSDDVRDDDVSPGSRLETPNVLHRKRQPSQPSRTLTHRNHGREPGYFGYQRG
jgi:hypothetical protein